MKTEKMNQANPGIRCVVQSCTFYMSGDQCCAACIEVSPKNATSAKQTECSSFEKK